MQICLNTLRSIILCLWCVTEKFVTKEETKQLQLLLTGLWLRLWLCWPSDGDCLLGEVQRVVRYAGPLGVEVMGVLHDVRPARLLQDGSNGVS